MRFRLDADMPTTCGGQAGSGQGPEAARAEEPLLRGDGPGRRPDAWNTAQGSHTRKNKNPATGNRRVDTSGGVVHAPGIEDLEELSSSLSQVASQPAGGDTELFQPGVGSRKQLSQSSKRVRFPWSHSMSRSMHGASQSSQEEQPSGVEECLNQRHDLPFSSTSPTWMRAATSRASAEERMAKLVKTLEAEVIPRLVEAHRSVGESTSVVAGWASPTDAEIEAFVQLALGANESAAMQFVDERLEQRLPVEAACLELLAPAAARLGVMWEDDLCDFNAVTLGVGRMQKILYKLSPSFVSDDVFPANARRIALVSAPCEQHTFGLSMVAEFFLHAGWDVMVGCGGDRDEAVDLAGQQWFDVIGFSVGSESRLDWLASCITAVRAASRNPNIAVLVGGPIFVLNPEYVSLVGADATSGDAKQAPIVAAEIVTQRFNWRG
jgi:methanogenic corrinoid protein MtbC1